MRRPLVVGNWKMNGSQQEVSRLLQELVSLQAGSQQTEVAVCAPFTYLQQVADCLKSSDVSCGAQDVSVHLNGAYTGEVSASMLVDCGCTYVIVGHSERRQYHRESNLFVAQKTLAAQQANLIPIVCVGETLEEREAEQTLNIVGEQLMAVRSIIGETGFTKLVLAYEPVWAIGTGLTASPQQAQEVHQFIREQLGSVADSVRILYGGSVKPENAAELFLQKDIDGALVGGASLVGTEFVNIVDAYTS